MDLDACAQVTNTAHIVVECQEEIVKVKRKKRYCKSKFFKHLLECLEKKKHQHMLSFCNMEKTRFRVIFTDKKSPHWEEKDISLFEEQDAIFHKKREKVKYELKCKIRFKANMSKLCGSGVIKKVGEDIIWSTCKREKVYEILKFPIGDWREGANLKCKKSSLFHSKDDSDKACCDDPDSFEKTQMTNDIKVSHYACLSRTPICGENQVEPSVSHACMIRESSDSSDVQNMEDIQPDIEVCEMLNRLISEALNTMQTDDVPEKVEFSIQLDKLLPGNYDIKVDYTNNLPQYSQEAKLYGNNDMVIMSDFNLNDTCNECSLTDELLPGNYDIKGDYTNNLPQYSQEAKLYGNNDMEIMSNFSLNNTFNGCNLTDEKLFENNLEIENVDSNNLLLYKDPQLELCPDNLDHNNMNSLENPMLSSAIEVEDMVEDKPYNHLECSSLEEEWLLRYSDISDF